MSSLFLVLVLAVQSALSDITDCKAELWKDVDKGGDKYGPFVRGEYKPPEIETNVVSSVAIFGGKCCRIKLFEGNSFQKGQASITKSTEGGTTGEGKFYNLNEEGTDFNDKVGSFQVYCESTCEVFLYETGTEAECEEGGTCRKGPLMLGDYDTAKLIANGVDTEAQIQSLRVRGDPNCRARMFNKAVYEQGYHNIAAKQKKQKLSMKLFVCNVYIYENEGLKGKRWGPFGPGRLNSEKLKEISGFDASEQVIGSIDVRGSECCVARIFKDDMFKGGYKITNEVIEIGPYKDTGSRALRYGPHNYGYTAETCMEACPQYTYFALQHNGWCCCDNDLEHATKYGEAVCGKLGGGWCNYIYKRGPPKEYTPHRFIKIGAYKDADPRALRYGPWRPGYTVQKCMESCPLFKYFALQAGSWCVCDNDLEHATMHGEGDCGEQGGSWCNFIYEKGPPINAFSMGKHERLGQTNHMKSMTVGCAPSIPADAPEEEEHNMEAGNENAEEDDDDDDGGGDTTAAKTLFFNLMNPSFWMNMQMVLINVIVIFVFCFCGLLLAFVYVLRRNRNKNKPKFLFVDTKEKLSEIDVTNTIE